MYCSLSLSPKCQGPKISGRTLSLGRASGRSEHGAKMFSANTVSDSGAPVAARGKVSVLDEYRNRMRTGRGMVRDRDRTGTGWGQDWTW